ncbi:ABC transporter permease [Poritiphilus flavus]|uniref:FtsX-like permease family protein n=1 Tax=Poritiphilus flavus TaxID=2697053 RepID=A0A6L9EAN4_9FLAO|nr:ABC transporter permease [Poritiphilus flavus]NAS11621.1 FtsX-like permease family protein [Poritiphilus flavus]
MRSNFFRIAFRKFWKQKASTFTKLFSLIVGIVSLFYIGVYIFHETSYDRFHRNYNNIYKLNTAIISPTGNLSLGLSATPLGPYLQTVVPEIKKFVRINKEYGSHALRYQDQLFSETENIYYADPDFFALFNFDFLRGNPDEALIGPNKVVITERMAQKYMGSLDAVNKTINYDDKVFTVTAVLKDLPSNSHLQFDFLVSMDTFMAKSDPNATQNWTWCPMNTYLLINENARPGSLEQSLKNIPAYLEETEAGDRYVASIEPLKGLHFSDPKLGELGTKGKISDLYVLLGIGIMILLLAVSNFINLSTAQFSFQHKEVFVKKTVGATRSAIFSQFFNETVLLSSLATVLALFVILASSGVYGDFLGYNLDLSWMYKPLAILGLILIPMALSLLGGIFPAFKYSKIAEVSGTNIAKRKQYLIDTRSALVAFQFLITSGLIIGALLIYSQMKYLNDKDLGMDIAQRIVLEYGPNSGIGNSFETLKEELGQIPGIETVSFSSHVPGQIPNGVSTGIYGLNGHNSNGEINVNLVDYDFIKDYGLEIIAGRDFRRGEADRTSALILNESAVKAFGFQNPEDILGASFEQWGGDGKVIGVVKDFNYLSLHQKVGLLSLKIWPDQFMKISMRINPLEFENTLEQLASKWTSLYPQIPFNYYFVDDNFRAQYNKDQQFASIINGFTLVSICIGILGLIAYATFWCGRRRKELSIRKVLGATTGLLTWRLYSGFSIPVLSGFVLAIPLAYYLGKQWLQGFAYQVELQWYFFIIPLGILLVFTWLAVGVQTLRVVSSNPVDNLKEE